MYWIPPSLPLKSLSRPTPTVCRTDVGTFERVYADVITNFPSSIAFQFLQECRLRDQLSAHSKPGLPVTILALWWWRWWLSSLFSTSSRLGQEIKLGLSKYFFLSTYGLSRSFHFIVPYFFRNIFTGTRLRYRWPSWFHMYRGGVGVYSGGRREAKKKPSPDSTILRKNSGLWTRSRRSQTVSM